MKFTSLTITALFFTALLTSGANAANVGYYEMGDGQGDPQQVQSITDAGHTPVDIIDLSPGELAGIVLLMVTNESNGSYGAEYLGALVDIEAAVNNGLILMIHDRYVDPAETILPGDGATANIIRDFSNDEVIEFLPPSSVLTSGPGGSVGPNGLNDLGSSSHGYIEGASLPAGSAAFLSTSNPNDIVSFAYTHGSGGVYYSTIPLDAQYGENDVDAYAANAVAFGAGGFDLTSFPAFSSHQAVPAVGLWGLIGMAGGLILLARRRLKR